METETIDRETNGDGDDRGLMESRCAGPGGGGQPPPPAGNGLRRAAMRRTGRPRGHLLQMARVAAAGRRWTAG